MVISGKLTMKLVENLSAGRHGDANGVAEMLAALAKAAAQIAADFGDSAFASPTFEHKEESA
jgi:hypothetical protein